MLPKSSRSCFILADVLVILWLWLFTDGPLMDKGVLVPFVVVILVVKSMVYAMMHIDGKREAKQLNQKLNEYKQGEGHGNEEL